MKKVSSFMLSGLICLLLTAALVACGDSPTSAPSATTAAATTAAATKAATSAAATTAAATTAAPAATTAAATTAAATTPATTTAAATTVAATTASATTASATTTSATTAASGTKAPVAISGAPKAPSPKAPAPKGTPSAKETVPATVTDTNSDPFLALLGKVGAASLQAKSAKIGLAVTPQATGSTAFTAFAILADNNDFAMAIDAAGNQIGLVMMSNNFFLNAGGAWQQVTDKSQLAPFQSVFNIIQYVIPNDKELAKFAGSTMQVYNNEQLDDGTPIGYIVIDTSTAADESVKSLGTVVYAYDPKTYLVSYFYSTSPTVEISLAIADYNDPTNKITNPLTDSGAAGVTTASATTAAAAATTPAATTASATTAAASSSTTVSGIPPYEGATAISLSDTLKSQFSGSTASVINNPQVIAFVTKDPGTTVKSNYSDYFTKNGWKDLSSAAGNTAASQIESAGGFYLVFNKDKQVVVLIGLPSAAASSLGVQAADIPSGGTVVIGFSGDAK